MKLAQDGWKDPMLGKQGKTFSYIFPPVTLSRWGATIVSMRKENEIVLVGGISQKNEEVFSSIKVQLIYKKKLLHTDCFIEGFEWKL